MKSARLSARAPLRNLRLQPWLAVPVRVDARVLNRERRATHVPHRSAQVHAMRFSGSNLTSQTFFDVRVSRSGSNDSVVVLHWQRELTAKHDVATGTAPGDLWSGTKWLRCLVGKLIEVLENFCDFPAFASSGLGPAGAGQNLCFRI